LEQEISKFEQFYQKDAFPFIEMPINNNQFGHQEDQERNFKQLSDRGFTGVGARTRRSVLFLSALMSFLEGVI
jgi:hypothetical protein